MTTYGGDLASFRSNKLGTIAPGKVWFWTARTGGTQITNVTAVAPDASVASGVLTTGADGSISVARVDDGSVGGLWASASLDGERYWIAAQGSAATGGSGSGGVSLDLSGFVQRTELAAYVQPADLAGYAKTATLPPVATTGAYQDLTGRPAIPVVPVAGTTAGTYAAGNDPRITGAVQGTGITALVAITQAAYDALATKAPATLYVITG